jgi:hypothetical protein
VAVQKCGQLNLRIGLTRLRHPLAPPDSPWNIQKGTKGHA